MASDHHYRQPHYKVHLTEDFQLSNLDSLPNAPQVDKDLLLAFIKHSCETDEQVTTVLANLDRYQEWRDALIQFIEEDQQRPPELNR